MTFCATIIISCFIEAYTPPIEFDYEPTVPYTVTVLNAAQMMGVCQMTPPQWAWGCTVHTETQHIFIDAALPPEAYYIILQHEKAHVNGWRH